MVDEAARKARIAEILEAQRFAVLATVGAEGPYTSLVAFTAADDLRSVLFATLRTTRKYAYLAASGAVSLLIDTRSGTGSDFEDAEAVTVLGRATDVPEEERADAVRRHVGRHPELEDFLSSPLCALVRVEVERYLLVSRFREAQVVEMR